jgi:RNA polymerase sigma-70 factor, ECF subfamily
MAQPLLQRIASGDSAAVALCLDEYGGTIWSLADRYLRGFGDDLEDAVQEVFVEVWRAAGRYDPAMGGEPAFIATIAHRRLIDRQRRLQSRRALQLDEDAVVLEAKPSPDAHREAATEETRRAARAFEQLDHDEKQALWYALYRGFTHERIAEAINVPLGTVKTRIRRGLAKMRELLLAQSLHEPAHAAKGGAS